MGMCAAAKSQHPDIVRMRLRMQCLTPCDNAYSGLLMRMQSTRLRVFCAQVYKGSVSEGNVAYPTVGKAKPAGRAEDLPSAPPLPQVGSVYFTTHLFRC